MGQILNGSSLDKATQRESQGRRPSCCHVVLKGGTGRRRSLVGGIFCATSFTLMEWVGDISAGAEIVNWFITSGNTLARFLED